jgi:hypothetical protein
MKKILIQLNTVVMRKMIIYTIILIGMFSIPYLGYTQPVNPGGNPDGNPPVVPIDNRMNIILIVLGLIIAIVVYKKMKNRAVVKNV